MRSAYVSAGGWFARRGYREGFVTRRGRTNRLSFTLTTSGFGVELAMGVLLAHAGVVCMVDVTRGLLPAFLFCLEAMGDGRKLRSVVYGFPAMVFPNAYASYPTNNVYGIAYQLERPGIGLVFTWPCQ